MIACESLLSETLRILISIMLLVLVICIRVQTPCCAEHHCDRLSVQSLISRLRDNDLGIDIWDDGKQVK